MGSDRNRQAFDAAGKKLFEVNEVTDIFAPVWTRWAYELALGMLLFLALWSYAAVFGNTMTEKFPMLQTSEDCDPNGTYNCKLFLLPPPLLSRRNNCGSKLLVRPLSGCTC